MSAEDEGGIDLADLSVDLPLCEVCQAAPTPDIGGGFCEVCSDAITEAIEREVGQDASDEVFEAAAQRIEAEARLHHRRPSVPEPEKPRARSSVRRIARQESIDTRLRNLRRDAPGCMSPTAWRVAEALTLRLDSHARAKVALADLRREAGCQNKRLPAVIEELVGHGFMTVAVGRRANARHDGGRGYTNTYTVTPRRWRF